MQAASGEPGYSILERLWSRPSCEITGITGGYSGDGFKTIIPAKAEASISFRLVNKQCPQKIRNSFQQFVRKNLPPSCKVAFEGRDGTMSSNVSTNNPLISIAQNALEEEWGIKPIFAGSGASIPIVTDLKSILNVDSLLVGFSQDGDNIHAPNEKYELSSFFRGSNTWARIINQLRSI